MSSLLGNRRVVGGARESLEVHDEAVIDNCEFVPKRTGGLSPSRYLSPELPE